MRDGNKILYALFCVGVQGIGIIIVNVCFENPAGTEPTETEVIYFEMVNVPYSEVVVFRNVPPIVALLLLSFPRNV